MKRTLAFIFVCFAMISADLVRLSPPPLGDTTTKIKAVFLYNFTKYIEWPQSYKSGNFIIGVLGDEGFAKDLDVFFSPKAIGSQRFEVASFEKVSELKKCHMIYISPSYNGRISDVLGKIKGNSTLVVTEKEGMAKQGSAINFTVVDNKQKFELNKANAERYDLKVSSSLMNLAIKVE